MVGVLDPLQVEAAAGGPIGMQQVGVPFGIKLTAQDTRNNTVTGFSGNGPDRLQPHARRRSAHE
jgi:hypothetical protein